MAYLSTSLRVAGLVFVLGASACGDDSTPVPCTVPSAEACMCEDGRSGVRMCLPTMNWGECDCSVTMDSGVPDATMDSALPDAAPDADATVDSTLPDAGVTWPASPDDYVAGLVSRVDSLTIPAFTDGVPVDCCRDFGAISRDNITSGTDEMDNAFAELANAVADIGPGLDLQAVLDSTLASGELNILLDHQGFEGDPDPAFILAALDGVPDSGGYLIDRATFMPGTGTPRSLFEPASVDSGNLSAGPGELTLALPFAGISLAYTFKDVQIESTVTTTTGGVTYTAGRISGYLPADDYFDVINDFVATSCSCLALTEPLYTGSGSSRANNCLDQATVDTRCPSMADAPCREVAAGADCTASPLLISSLADLDTDTSAAGFESLSLGLRFTAAPVTVTGVTP
jgi:hypothetical protein